MIVFAWIIVGLITGWMANLTMPFERRGYYIAGAIGAVIAGALSSVTIKEDYRAWSLLIALMGAAVQIGLLILFVSGKEYEKKHAQELQEFDRMYRQHHCPHLSVVAIDETFDICEDCGRRWLYIFSPRKAHNRR